MKHGQTEKEIFDEAMDKLRELVPEKLLFDDNYKCTANSRYVAPQVKITYKCQENWFTIVVRPVIAKADAILLMYYKLGENMLFIARHINNETADALRHHGINFIDTVGNAYINNPPVYIWVTGKQRPKTGTINPKGLFTPTGLRILFTFLCFEGLEQKPYRTIAHTADVALGGIGWYMRALKDEGYLIDNGKDGLGLLKKRELFHRWVVEYPERLKPKLLLGRYAAADNWLNTAKLDPATAQWGGEVAAAKLTGYLKPQTGTIYIKPEALNEFLLQNRLRKEPAGEIEILERYWNEPVDYIKKETVNPILVYADILAAGDQRNTETAKLIYEKYIAQHIGQN